MLAETGVDEPGLDVLARVVEIAVAEMSNHRNPLIVPG